MTLYFSGHRHIEGCFVLKFWIFSMHILLDKLLSSSFSLSQQMRWSNEHDVMFLERFWLINLEKLNMTLNDCMFLSCHVHISE